MGGTREAEGQRGTAHLVIPPVLVRVVAVAIPHGELYPVASMVCVVCCIRVAKEANGRADLGRLPAQRRLKDMRAIKLDCDGRVLLPAYTCRQLTLPARAEPRARNVYLHTEFDLLLARVLLEQVRAEGRLLLLRFVAAGGICAWGRGTENPRGRQARGDSFPRSLTKSNNGRIEKKGSIIS